MALTLLREVCLKSTVHCLRYLVEPNISLLGRAFWVVALIATVNGMCFMVKNILHLHSEHAVSFTLDTAYLRWKTPFPAISVCEMESAEKIYEAAVNLFGEERDMDLDLFLRDVAYFGGTCYTCKSHCSPGLLKCPDNLAQITESIRSECEDVLSNCKWNERSFPCCQWFRMLHTELGRCYTINSLLAPNQTALKTMVGERLKQPGTLQFDSSENIKVFVHAREAVPHLNQLLEEHALVYWGTFLELRFAIRTVENSPALKSIDPEIRGCLLQGEKPLTAYSHYSYSACIAECRAQAQLHFCNCTHHLMPPAYKGPTCGVEGLVCLTKFAEELRSVRTSWFNAKPGLVCDCPPACTEPEIEIIWKHTQVTSPKGTMGSRIVVKMDALPTVRYQRNVVRDRLDLVVSMGGAATLFLGASLLSLVELFYLCFSRLARPSTALKHLRQRMQNY